MIQKGRPEAWIWAAFGLGAAIAGGWVYLLLRPGGSGPVWFYGSGRFLGVLAALGLALVGTLVACMRRPRLTHWRVRGFGVLLLIVGAAPFPVPYPSSREFRPSSVEFRLPVQGPWRVVWGDDGASGPLAHLPARRWGLCLVREQPGRLRPGKDQPDHPADFWAYGEAVLAPAAGLVVAAVDGHVDRVPGRSPAGPPAGNHVVLEVAEGEYVVLAHLAQGSLLVEPGAQVAAGAPLGQVGASGTGALWGEPHLALHLQTDPEPFAGEGIPWAFHGYRVNGALVPAGLPRGGVALNGTLTGQVVQHGSGAKRE